MAKQFTFTQTPTIKKPRSRFDLSAKRLTSGNVGELIPFYLQEVYPGDTMKLNATCVSRLSSSFLKPIMDNLFLDTYFFYVPSRLLYNKFVNVFGENTESAWANTAEYDVPQVPISSATVNSKSVADYLGLPLGNLGVPVSVLPFRAFAKVYEDWFRDQNNVSPMHIQNGEFVTSERLNSNDWAPNNYTGKLPKVAKMHDYFTSCLPSPQKGSVSSLPLATSGDVAVYSSNTGGNMSLSSSSVKLGRMGGSSWPTGNFDLYAVNSSPQTSTATLSGLSTSSTLSGTTNAVGFDNLWAKTSDLGIEPLTVNDLRLAFQLQKMLERDARGGTRYCEYLLSHWGVSAGDSRLQRSEFLGGRRTPINVQQVAQTSEGSKASPLAQVAAFSLTASRARATKGFVEHGFVIGVCCIRQFHTYQQGVQRFWTRSKRTDFFEPVFSNISEQPVYKYELYGTGTSDAVSKPFGYNEAWADLRYNPNLVTGQMRSGITESMDLWHLADYYDNAPTLNATFIEETPKYLNRAISVESTEQDQFILDFYVQNIAYRELPTYSIPSLIDHN